MTDRLDRIEAVLAENARQLEITRQLVDSNAVGLRETRAIADSNARAIEAWRGRAQDNVAAAKATSMSVIADMNRSMDARIADTSQIIIALGQQQQQAGERFEAFLQEARADRELNESEHRAFRETFQTLLAVVARRWHGVAE